MGSWSVEDRKECVGEMEDKKIKRSKERILHRQRERRGDSDTKDRERERERESDRERKLQKRDRAINKD